MEKLSENCINMWDSKLHHVFNFEDICVCLVCKESIPIKFPLDNDALLASHVNTLKHYENVKTLFNFCIPNFEHDYLDMIQNLVFNILLETNETSYVLKFGNNFKCLVCQVMIGHGSADSREISESIINHLDTDFHVNNVKDNCHWVYPLDNEVSFMMFHKFVVFCSSCKQNVQIMKSCPMESAANHLKVHHVNKYRNIKQQKTIRTNSEEKNISKVFLRQNDHDLPSTSFDSSNGKHNVVRRKENTCRSLEELLETHKNSTDEFDDVIFSDSSDIESSSESYDFFQNALVCPECKELIEIYNENPVFSLDLHMQKHKHFRTPNDDIDLRVDYQENADYVCPVCQETIKIFNRNLEFSVNLHFEEKRHEHERFNFPDDKSTTVNKFDFVNRVFDCLPDVMQEHRGVFVLDGNEVFCKLCNCMLSSSKIIADACKVFSDHVTNAFHSNQYKISKQLLTLTVIDFNKQDSQKQVDERDSLFDSLAEKNLIINKNRTFVEKHSGHYYCTICNKWILYASKENSQVSNFLTHFNGKFHIKSFNYLKKKKENRKNSRITETINSNSKKEIRNEKGESEVKENATMEKAQKRAHKILITLVTHSWIVNKNARFIKTRMGNFFCKRCNETIVCTNSGIHLKEHLKNKTHTINKK